MAGAEESDADRIARLQQELAVAAAQLARVRAELHEVTGAPPSRPFVVPGGAADDPSPYVGEQQGDQIRELLVRLGVDPDAASIGAVAGFVRPPAPTTERLADPPRRVPAAFRLAAFGWSWWEGFGVLMGVVAPIALWGNFSFLVPGGLLGGLVVIAYLRGRRSVRRLALLRWGKVATVTRVDEVSRGTYFSGTTYNNLLVPQARGWAVARRWYSGPASTSRIDYTLDGVPGSMVLRGLPYVGGVVVEAALVAAAAYSASYFWFG